MGFPHLFTPLTLRSVTLRNRVVLLPMGTRLVRDGAPSDESVAFYGARAAGGVGLVFTGGTDADRTNSYRGRRSLAAWDDANIPLFRRLTDRVHAEGVPIFGQLAHLGREHNREPAPEESETPALGPSPVAGSSALPPKVMTEEDIANVTAGYVHSVSNLRAAGYDGIEIQANHGYLLAQFLSKRTNRRTDRYGGPLEGRARMLLGIIDAVRARIGDEVPLGVRLSSDEEVDEGMGVSECKEIVALLEATGKVDYISLSIGLAGNYVKDMASPAGYNVSRASEIKRSTKLPVIISQRITHPSQAERILSDGAADLIGMARALIADPEWVAKAAADRVEEIRPCVGAIQGCHTFPIGCVHSPEAGRETRWAPGSVRAAAAQRKRVVVVGGGPAGLEAATIAATRGHTVTLLEREPALGGQVTLAAKAPHRAELHGVVSFRASELARLGVDVRTGVTATAETVLAERPDAVIIATGARPRRATFDGAELPHVVNVWQLFDGSAEALLAAAKTAVVVDDGSNFWEVCSSAELLAGRGIRVAFVTPAASVGLGVPKDSIRTLIRRLKRGGVRFHPLSRVLAVEPGIVTICDSVRLEAEQVIDAQDLEADLVVAHAGKEAVRSLADDLAGKGPAVHEVGDCLAPRRIREAVFDGYRVARDL